MMDKKDIKSFLEFFGDGYMLILLLAVIMYFATVYVMWGNNV